MGGVKLVACWRKTFWWPSHDKYISVLLVTVMFMVNGTGVIWGSQGIFAEIQPASIFESLVGGLGADDAQPKPEVRGQRSEVRSQRDEVDFFNGSFLVDPK